MAEALFEQYIEDIAARVETLRSEGVSPVVIGMDGMAASGKTTLAALLAERLDAAVIHMDDFFLPQGFRTPERLRTPGGNVYYERFCKEVVPYIRSGQLFGYRVFDAHKHIYTDNIRAGSSPASGTKKTKFYRLGFFMSNLRNFTIIRAFRVVI